MRAQDVFASIDTVLAELGRRHYITDDALATLLYLAHHLQKPLFLEGEPGVGKTEVALVLAALLDTRLIRLQCYEGLDAASALYEWDYVKQLLRIKMETQCAGDPAALGSVIYTEPYLIKRPLLEAIRQAGDRPPVLLIDELDRADEEFEAFLLEVLADFQVTIPELGTVTATVKPMVVITSNRTREIHDALKRRCLYHWIDYPDPQKELRILEARLPGIDTRLAAQVTHFMQTVRQENFVKRPGVSESLDWAAALIRLNADDLDAAVVERTLGCIFKYREDLQQFKAGLWSNPRGRAALLAPDVPLC